MKDRIQCVWVADRHELEPHPHGASENRQDGPGVVDQGAGQHGDDVQPKRPGAEKHADRMQAIRGRKGDEHSDRKRQCGPAGRVSQMEDLLRRSFDSRPGHRGQPLART